MAAREKIRLFQSATGIPVDEDEVLAASSDGVVPGELIADILLAKKEAPQYEILRPYLPGGAKSDMPNVRFYWDFFSEGKAAYVPVHYISLADAVSLIHDAGGISVLAHPGQNLDRGETELLESLLFREIDGIEHFPPITMRRQRPITWRSLRKTDFLSPAAVTFTADTSLQSVSAATAPSGMTAGL